MKNVLDQLCETAVDTLKMKIEWRKTRIAESERILLAKVLGDNSGDYTIEQTCAGLATLRSTLAELERLLASLQPPVVEPVKAKRGRPSKKK